jgi:ferritin
MIMVISQKMQDAVNKQINAELFSSYLYQSMSAWCTAGNLKGFAHWFTKQAGEEDKHANKFRQYVLDRGGRVKLAAIEAPKTEWKSALETFSDAYQHELKVTGLINDLYKTAVDEKDVASQVMLNWFITEQVEEEASTNEILELLKMIGDSKGSLFMVDKKLAKRE